MNDTDSAGIRTFGADGRPLGAPVPERQTAPSAPTDARPFADVAATRVYLGVPVAAPATAFIVIERENGYRQIIDATPDRGSAAGLASLARPEVDVAATGLDAPSADVDGPTPAGDPDARSNDGVLSVVTSDDVASLDADGPDTALATSLQHEPSPHDGRREGAPHDASPGAASNGVARYGSPDTMRVDLTPPDYANVDASGTLTVYANELVANAERRGLSVENEPTPPGTDPALQTVGARDVTVANETDRAMADRSSDSWSSSLVVETAGAVGAADLARVSARLERLDRESAALATTAETTASDGRTPSAGFGAPAVGTSGDVAIAASPAPDAVARTTRPPDGPPASPETPKPGEPKPELTPVERAETAVPTQKAGRELVGDRPAFDRAADARLDSLHVKYNEFDVQETLASERTAAARVGGGEMAYVRDGESATMRPGYQQEGRIVGMTAETVTQDIGQNKIAVYGTKGLMENATDPNALAETLSRAAQQGTPVEFNFTRSGGIQVGDPGLAQGRGQAQEQDRGMSRSLF